VNLAISTGANAMILAPLGRFVFFMPCQRRRLKLFSRIDIFFFLFRGWWGGGSRWRRRRGRRESHFETSPGDENARVSRLLSLSLSARARALFNACVASDFF